MRKNILFIANFNQILKGTNAILARTFNTQMCPPDPKMVEKTLTVMEPDLILWYISGLDFPVMNSVSNVIEKTNTEVLLTVFGTSAECEMFKVYFDRRIMVDGFLLRPVSAPEIVSVLSKQLKTDQNNTTDMATQKMSLSDFAATLTEDKRRCILLVDDDGRILRAMKMILEKDYRVNLANSAKSAFDSIERDRPDAILLDYEMPVCNGKQTLEIIRRSDNMKNIPVFFLTGIADKERVKEVIHLKPQGYLLKNSEQSVILSVLEKFFDETHE